MARYYANLRTCIRESIKRGWFDCANPLERLQRPPTQGPGRDVTLTEEEAQRFLQAENRARREGGETPEERSDAVARWAQEHQLPYEDSHVQFPDARIEYEGRDGRRAVEDIEVVTPHYRGAHAAAKVRAGFSRYRAVGARLGGLRTTGRSGRGVDPRLAEELLQ